MDLHVKRVRDEPGDSDGRRILVDRLWPRGLTKERVAAEWWRDVGPSDELRRWFGHDPERWNEFRTRYHVELDANPLVDDLRAALKGGRVTLLFGAKDTEHNQAVALAEYLRGSPI